MSAMRRSFLWPPQREPEVIQGFSTGFHVTFQVAPLWCNIDVFLIEVLGVVMFNEPISVKAAHHLFTWTPDGY